MPVLPQIGCWRVGIALWWAIALLSIGRDAYPRPHPRSLTEEHLGYCARARPAAICCRLLVANRIRRCHELTIGGTDLRWDNPNAHHILQRMRSILACNVA